MQLIQRRQIDDAVGKPRWDCTENQRTDLKVGVAQVSRGFDSFWRFRVAPVTANRLVLIAIAVEAEIDVFRFRLGAA